MNYTVRQFYQHGDGLRQDKHIDQLLNDRVFIFDPYRRLVAIPRIYCTAGNNKAVTEFQGQLILSAWAKSGALHDRDQRHRPFPWILASDVCSTKEMKAIKEWWNSPRDRSGLRLSRFPDKYLPKQIREEKMLAQQFKAEAKDFVASFDVVEEEDKPRKVTASARSGSSRANR